MKRILPFLLVALAATFLTACSNSKAKNDEAIKVADDEVIVYFCKDITPENILKLYEAL